MCIFSYTSDSTCKSSNISQQNCIEMLWVKNVKSHILNFEYVHVHVIEQCSILCSKSIFGIFSDKCVLHFYSTH